MNSLRLAARQLVRNAGFSTVAIVTLAIGIGASTLIASVYGAITFDVAQRTREIGVRVALGAQRPAVVALIVERSFAVAAAGIAAGLVAAFWGSRLAAALLYGVSPHDPGAYAAAALALFLAAAAAASVPALRAARVDPLVALRHE